MNSADGTQLTNFPARGGKKRQSRAARSVWANVVLLGVMGCQRSCDRAPHQDPNAATLAQAIPVAQLALVTNNGSDSLSLLDLSASGATRTLSLDFDARREAPHHLALTADRLFVALAHPREAPPNPRDHRAHGRSATTPGEIAVLARADLRLTTRLTVDESPGDLQVTHAGDRLLVTHFDLARAFEGAARGAAPRELFATLQVWDTRALHKLEARALCVAPHGIAISDDDRTAFVACYGSDELAIVDLSRPGLATDKIPLGTAPGPLGAPAYGPYAATLTPDQREVLVSTMEGQAVAVFDRERRTFVASVPVRARAMLSCMHSTHVAYVPLAAPDGLVRLERRDGAWSETGRSALDGRCLNPHAAVCSSGGALWVVCEGDHRSSGVVLAVDPQTLAPTARFEVGVYPDGMTLALP